MAEVASMSETSPNLPPPKRQAVGSNPAGSTTPIPTKFMSDFRKLLILRGFPDYQLSEIAHALVNAWFANFATITLDDPFIAGFRKYLEVNGLRPEYTLTMPTILMHYINSIAHNDPPPDPKTADSAHQLDTGEAALAAETNRAEAMCERLAEAMRELASCAQDYGDTLPKLAAINQAWSALRVYRQSKETKSDENCEE